MTTYAHTAATLLDTVRRTKPLVHNITNFVVMNTTANALLACGASPIMAHATDELAEMVTLAGSVVLNIGTLDPDWIAAMRVAGLRARELGKPLVLDPVGSGASALRTTTVQTLLAESNVSVLRGNASEILSLAGKSTAQKGVDATDSVDHAAHTASALAQVQGTVLAITGPTDLVTDGMRTLRIEGGHPLMPYVTGTGCTASALVGAFLTATTDTLMAAASALAYLALAGEQAGAKACGPGSFQMHLLDALYQITPQELEAGCHIFEMTHV
ncbi:hydroxyethylthiazole kinase [Desulfovibrionales bacterium]